MVHKAHNITEVKEEGVLLMFNVKQWFIKHIVSMMFKKILNKKNGVKELKRTCIFKFFRVDYFSNNGIKFIHSFNNISLLYTY